MTAVRGGRPVYKCAGLAPQCGREVPIRPVQAVSLFVLATATSACPAPLDPGFVWDVTLTTADDGCAGGAADDYSESFDYVLQFDDAGSGARVGILEDEEPVTFAVGSVAGCDLDYGSVIWDDIRDGYLLRWRIEGEARWRTGGDLACNLEPGTDWLGTEIVEIVGSEHPDYAAGCQVELDVVGTYTGEL